MLKLIEQEKYSRQTILSNIGPEGQKKLKTAKVIIVGVGALGTNTAEFLTRAGIGEITLIDDDVIEESNLQRQTLFSEEDLGKNKTTVAKEKLKKINSLIKINTINNLINEKNLYLLNTPVLILDCSDNFKTRFLINNYCKKEKIPWVYSACVKTSGYVMPIFPKGPCLNCFLKESLLDTSCAIGILNTLPAAISSIQSTLAIKIILEKETPPFLLHFDLWKQELRKIKVSKTCPNCL